MKTTQYDNMSMNTDKIRIDNASFNLKRRKMLIEQII